MRAANPADALCYPSTGTGVSSMMRSPLSTSAGPCDAVTDVVRSRRLGRAYFFFRRFVFFAPFFAAFAVFLRFFAMLPS